MYIWLWILIGIGAIILEIITSISMVSLWFALGAGISLIVAYLGFDFGIQIILFFVSSIAFFLVFKPLSKKYLIRKLEATNSDRYVGRRYILIKGINTDSGQIKINDLIWNVISNDGNGIKKGEIVEVVAFEGSKAVVRKVK